MSELRDLSRHLHRVASIHTKEEVSRITQETRTALSHRITAQRRIRWILGVLSVLAVCSFTVSLIILKAFSNGNLNTMVRWTYTKSALTVAAEFFLLAMYMVKASHASVKSVLPPNLLTLMFHSPYLKKMIVEMSVWAVHCPPPLARYLTFNAQGQIDREPLVTAKQDLFLFINIFSLVRLYSVILFVVRTRFDESIFAQCLTILCGLPLKATYFFRTNFSINRIWSSILAFFAGWTLVSVSYSAVEDLPLFDCYYFTFVTMSTIGYGDFVPQTGAGRTVAFASWVFGLIVVAWVVSTMHDALALSSNEEQLWSLFQANEYSGKIPAEAAKVLQRAFRTWHLRDRVESGKDNHVDGLWIRIIVQWRALLLSRQIIQFRTLRRRLKWVEGIIQAGITKAEDDDATREEKPPKVAREPLSPLGAQANEHARQPRRAPFRRATLIFQDELLVPIALPMNDKPISFSNSAKVSPVAQLDSTVNETNQPHLNRSFAAPTNLGARLTALETSMGSVVGTLERLVRRHASKEDARVMVHDE
jgi:hypothetical protein